MSRPPLEVADLIRAAGAAFIERNRSWIRWKHVKVLLAIARCRTAALGGHIDECPGCGYRATISYNSCIMGSIFYWRVRLRCEACSKATRPSDSPLKLALQLCDQFVWGTKRSLPQMGRNDGFNGLQFFGGISAGTTESFQRVYVDGAQRFVNWPRCAALRS